MASNRLNSDCCIISLPLNLYIAARGFHVSSLIGEPKGTRLCDVVI